MDIMSTDPETAAAPPAAPGRRLRRSATDRVIAGVAGGLGDYANVDPVLFRVLFAVSAFFGGAGALAYLVAWAVMPTQGTERAPIDGWVHSLRRHHVPPWLVAVVGGLLLWSVAFSWWWSPHWPWPLIALIAIPLLLLGTREGGPHRPAPNGSSEPIVTTEIPAVSLDKEPTASAPTWAADARSWFQEARLAARTRRRRSWPLRAAALVALAAALTALGVTDALVGIWLPVYFWIVGGIALVALVLGVVLRRAPWSLLPLLAFAVVGTVAFGGTHASLADGVGQAVWRPATAADMRGDYRLAFGQAVLDLRHVTPAAARDIRVTLGAGQVRVLLPATTNATVRADVRLGNVTVDGVDDRGWDEGRRGAGTDRTIPPPSGVTGPPVTIHVSVADGNITVVHR
jgi:phage shock protein PspC (stress-responsive transcriptional regulator)